MPPPQLTPRERRTTVLDVISSLLHATGSKPITCKTNTYQLEPHHLVELLIYCQLRNSKNTRERNGHTTKPSCIFCKPDYHLIHLTRSALNPRTYSEGTKPQFPQTLSILNEGSLTLMPFALNCLVLQNKNPNLA